VLDLRGRAHDQQRKIFEEGGAMEAGGPASGGGGCGDDP
jgi:hypothetical protein